MKSLFNLLLLIPLAQAKLSCGPPGTITIAGSQSVQILADKWKGRYQELCPDAQVMTEGGGSSAGAARVCGTRAHTTPVDVGGMTRNWNKVEAVSNNEWLFDCGRSQRNAIQVC